MNPTRATSTPAPKALVILATISMVAAIAPAIVAVALAATGQL